MRISDWSSDVCSSDLLSAVVHRLRDLQVMAGDALVVHRGELPPRVELVHALGHRPPHATGAGEVVEIGRASCRGKSVSVRVALGGRRIIQKKKQKNKAIRRHERNKQVVNKRTE